MSKDTIQQRRENGVYLRYGLDDHFVKNYKILPARRPVAVTATASASGPPLRIENSESESDSEKEKL